MFRLDFWGKYFGQASSGLSPLSFPKACRPRRLWVPHMAGTRGGDIRARSLLFLMLLIGGGPANGLAGMSMAEQLQQFRASHPITHRKISGKLWNFIVTGKNDQTVVILPGGGGDAESMFPVVSELERKYRVIAIGYPATVTTADGIVDGISAILDECGANHVCILGHSFGGMAARSFALKYPQRVDSLIMANFAVYSPSRRLFFRASLPVMARLPHAVLGWAIRSGFGRLLKNRTDREFWLTYVNQCEMMEPRSPGLRSQLLCMLDFLKNASVTPADHEGWNGRVLILESDRETGFTRRERHDFRRLYPNASVHVFAQAGHLSFITHTHEFVGAVEDFLATRETPTASNSF
jgi:pimeloyl-ACP methyl ester carboxylesterase